MATEYLPATSKQTAWAQSKDWWGRILGHPKRPEDFTEFVCSIITNPNDENQNYAVLTDEVKTMVYPHLTVPEMNYVNANKVPESDPGVQAVYAALAAGMPVKP